MSLTDKFCWIIFGTTFITTLFLFWRVFVMERKTHKLKQQIQKDLHFPGMEATRQFFKPHLKKYGIKIDDKHYEKN